MPKIFIPTPTRKFTDGQALVEISIKTGSTIQNVFEILDQKYPGVRFEFINEKGQAKSYIAIFINDQDIRNLKGMGTSVSDNDEIIIMPAIAGG